MQGTPVRPNLPYRDASKRQLLTAVVKKFLPSPFLANRAAPISVSLAFWTTQLCKHSEYNSWGAGYLVALCISLPCSFRKCRMLSREIACAAWYDSTGYRTPTYRVQSEHSTTGPAKNRLSWRQMQGLLLSRSSTSNIKNSAIEKGMLNQVIALQPARVLPPNLLECHNHHLDMALML